MPDPQWLIDEEVQRERDAECLAKNFHATYEALAPRFGYETRKASAVPWEDVPQQNRDLMISVAMHLLRFRIVQMVYPTPAPTNEET